MGKPDLAVESVSCRVSSEAAFRALAAACAKHWSATFSRPLLLGLEGELGAGKTTWVRGMLDGLGYTGRVPSPTYTLLEHYVLPGLDLVHVDLYRLGRSGNDGDAGDELEMLGLRDFLARSRCWVVVEWPERSAALRARCDLLVGLATAGEATARRVTLAPQSIDGCELIGGLQDFSENLSS